MVTPSNPTSFAVRTGVAVACAVFACGEPPGDVEALWIRVELSANGVPVSASSISRVQDGTTKAAGATDRQAGAECNAAGAWTDADWRVTLYLVPEELACPRPNSSEHTAEIRIGAPSENPSPAAANSAQTMPESATANSALDRRDARTVARALDAQIRCQQVQLLEGTKVCLMNRGGALDELQPGAEKTMKGGVIDCYDGDTPRRLPVQASVTLQSDRAGCP